MWLEVGGLPRLGDGSDGEDHDGRSQAGCGDLDLRTLLRVGVGILVHPYHLLVIRSHYSNCIICEYKRKGLYWPLLSFMSVDRSSYDGLYERRLEYAQALRPE